MFFLTYATNGMSYGDVESMETKDRWWYLKRLYQQKEAELRKIKER